MPKLESVCSFGVFERRQVNNYFLPKTAAERRAVKQKTTAMLSAKVGAGWGLRLRKTSRLVIHEMTATAQDVTTRAANQSLRELRQTILSTANADPLEECWSCCSVVLLCCCRYT